MTLENRFKKSFAFLTAAFRQPHGQLFRPIIALFLLFGACIALGSGSAFAVDLTKIERTIQKEPSYQSKDPKYCLLVFGPKGETRIWLVLDLVSNLSEADGSKNALYVDRNGNGDLTEPGERIACTMIESWAGGGFSRINVDELRKIYNPQFKVGNIVESDGKTQHTDLTVDMHAYVQGYRPCSLSLKIDGLGEQQAGGNLLRFADRPQYAPIIHFNGPLSLRVSMNSGLLHLRHCYDENIYKDIDKYERWRNENLPLYEQTKLIRGESRTPHLESSSLTAEIGTQGLGHGTFASISAGAMPENVHPVAEIAFPTRDPKKPPMIALVVLNQRSGTIFKGNVEVPEEAASGKAKISLAISDLLGIQISPTDDHVLVKNPVTPSPDSQMKGYGDMEKIIQKLLEEK